MNRITVNITIGGFLVGCALAFLPAASVTAVPAAPDEFILVQPDGTSFTALQWGDEWNNGVETISGYSILQQPDSWWVYARLTTGGLLGPALLEDKPRRVGIDSPTGLPLHLRPEVLRENPHSIASLGLACNSTGWSTDPHAHQCQNPDPAGEIQRSCGDIHGSHFPGCHVFHHRILRALVLP